MYKWKSYAGIMKKRRKKMKNKKRVLALILAGVLTLGCFPTTVGAVNKAGRRNNKKAAISGRYGWKYEFQNPGTCYVE